jgi:hypothetical protein
MTKRYSINNIKGFWGYYTLEDQMKEVPGVYVIFNGQGDSFIDVGQSENLNNRPENHERKSCWIKHCSKGIYFLAKVINNAEERTNIEQVIRNSHPEIPCGER